MLVTFAQGLVPLRAEFGLVAALLVDGGGRQVHPFGGGGDVGGLGQRFEEALAPFWPGGALRGLRFALSTRHRARRRRIRRCACGGHRRCSCRPPRLPRLLTHGLAGAQRIEELGHPCKGRPCLVGHGGFRSVRGERSAETKKGGPSGPPLATRTIAMFLMSNQIA